MKICAITSIPTRTNTAHLCHEYKTISSNNANDKISNTCENKNATGDTFK